MAPFQRMHIIAGMSAMICVLIGIPRIIDAFDVAWKNGITLISSLAIGGYLLGCIAFGIVKLSFLYFKKK